ncbi:MULTISPECIES: hypothetical protein [Bradyrhizobium]|uniref:hypothetical protein n=1 Tax=Bradyrhizobium TaxID=374 RepID=UPI0020A135C3|nr:hypothetical protein [Bradyrhizobium elkanii]MCP1969918.1 hypothetical protein [Bradyrhizobium elkanii]MCS4108574.1 hypothetical protein [Bradyrhizobium elkanii]
MIQETEKAGAVAGTDLRKTVLANSSEDSLRARRAQYLSEIFAMPADTAVTIADLAFGGAAHD